MMTLLHGDDIELSREELQRLINSKKSKDVRHIDGRKTDITELVQATSADSLFADHPLVVIENLFGSVLKKPKKMELLIDALRQTPKDADIVMWEQKELPATLVSKLGDSVTAKLFKTPVIIFKFLDGLRPGQAKLCLELYGELSNAQVPEVIFLMITRRVRQLIMVMTGITPEGLASWQMGRLTSQARAFTITTLQVMYKQLLAIDYSLKSGFSAFSLGEHLEQFVITFL